MIVISPESKTNLNGWCTSWKAWKNCVPQDHPAEYEDDEGYYEISLSAEYLSSSIEEIATTLLHEMVHLYNLQEGVKDTSRSGYYHNKAFRDAAEAHGLTVEKEDGRGYSKTSLNEEAFEFVRGLRDIQFDMFRTIQSGVTEKVSKTTVHRYVCPSCGNIVRATKVVRVGCLDCNREMIEQDDEIKNLQETFLPS